MPESGIGSQAALAAAPLPLFAFPSDLEPSSRWFGRNGDVIKLTMGQDGRMMVPGQSCGRLLDPARFRLLTSPVVLGRHDQANDCLLDHPSVLEPAPAAQAGSTDPRPI